MNWRPFFMDKERDIDGIDISGRDPSGAALHRQSEYADRGPDRVYRLLSDWNERGRQRCFP